MKTLCVSVSLKNDVNKMVGDGEVSVMNVAEVVSKSNFLQYSNGWVNNSLEEKEIYTFSRFKEKNS